MAKSKLQPVTLGVGLTLSFVLLGACSLPGPPQTGEEMPAKYANVHMPQGWWTDEAIVEEGRQIYLGIKKSNVNCAKCHGKTGKPVKSGARDFRNTSNMKKYSDSHLFWRIAEGIPFSTMKAFKGILSKEEIWKVIAFTRTFGLKGLQYDPEKNDWVSMGTGQPS